MPVTLWNIFVNMFVLVKYKFNVIRFFFNNRPTKNINWIAGLPEYISCTQSFVMGNVQYIKLNKKFKFNGIK